ncbi:MAG: hypothetical protein ABIL68_00795 [bacterium]
MVYFGLCLWVLSSGLCTAHPNIDVLLDAKALESYAFKVILEEYDFHKEYLISGVWP